MARFMRWLYSEDDISCSACSMVFSVTSSSELSRSAVAAAAVRDLGLAEDEGAVAEARVCDVEATLREGVLSELLKVVWRGSGELALAATRSDAGPVVVVIVG